MRRTEKTFIPRRMGSRSGVITIGICLLISNKSSQSMPTILGTTRYSRLITHLLTSWQLKRGRIRRPFEPFFRTGNANKYCANTQQMKVSRNSCTRMNPYLSMLGSCATLSNEILGNPALPLLPEACTPCILFMCQTKPTSWSLKLTAKQKGYLE